MPTIKASDANAIIGSFIPPSVVMPCAASTAPSGWLICDGTDYAQTDYKALYDLITSTYDTQMNPTTGVLYDSPGVGRFRVPDYRGSFLRGTGTAVNGSATTLGGWQADQMQGHWHHGWYSTGGNKPDIGDGSASARHDGRPTGDAIANLSHGTPRYGSETRPHNKGVNYIIKY